MLAEQKEGNQQRSGSKVVACVTLAMICGVALLFTDSLRHSNSDSGVIAVNNEAAVPGPAAEPPAVGEQPEIVQPGGGDDAAEAPAEGEGSPPVEEVVETVVETAVCPKSAITLRTSKAEYAATDTGVYFCNGAKDGCSRLSSLPKKEKTKSYSDLDTLGGSADWFCLCGSFNGWIGQVKSVNLCGKDYTAKVNDLKVSITAEKPRFYQCGKFEVNSIASAVKPWTPATWAACQMNVFSLMLETQQSSTKDLKDSSLYFKVSDSDASVYFHRWGENDFKRGNREIYYLTLPSLLTEQFEICSESDKKYVGEVLRLTAPMENGERMILTPEQDGTTFEIAKSAAPTSKDCAVFSVDTESTSFKFVKTVNSDAPASEMTTAEL